MLSRNSWADDEEFFGASDSGSRQLETSGADGKEMDADERNEIVTLESEIRRLKTDKQIRETNFSKIVWNLETKVQELNDEVERIAGEREGLRAEFDAKSEEVEQLFLDLQERERMSPEDQMELGKVMAALIFLADEGDFLWSKFFFHYQSSELAEQMLLAFSNDPGRCAEKKIKTAKRRHAACCPDGAHRPSDESMVTSNDWTTYGLRHNNLSGSDTTDMTESMNADFGLRSSPESPGLPSSETKTRKPHLRVETSEGTLSRWIALSLTFIRPLILIMAVKSRGMTGEILDGKGRLKLLWFSISLDGKGQLLAVRGPTRFGWERSATTVVASWDRAWIFTWGIGLPLLLQPSGGFDDRLQRHAAALHLQAPTAKAQSDGRAVTAIAGSDRLARLPPLVRRGRPDVEARLHPFLLQRQDGAPEEPLPQR